MAFINGILGAIMGYVIGIAALLENDITWQTPSFWIITACAVGVILNSILNRR